MPHLRNKRARTIHARLILQITFQNEWWNQSTATFALLIFRSATKKKKVIISELWLEWFSAASWCTFSFQFDVLTVPMKFKWVFSFHSSTIITASWVRDNLSQVFAFVRQKCDFYRTKPCTSIFHCVFLLRLISQTAACIVGWQCLEFLQERQADLSRVWSSWTSMNK